MPGALEDPDLPRGEDEDALSYIRRLAVYRGHVSRDSLILIDAPRHRRPNYKPFAHALAEIWGDPIPNAQWRDETTATAPGDSYEGPVVTAADVLTVDVAAHVAMVKRYARNATVGGVSRVRDGDERAAAIREDQWVGQATTLAAHVAMLDTTDEYESMRQEQDRNPTRGDGGSDFLTLPVDVKGSRMRGSTDPLRYRLPVRPKERHEGVRYVLALMPTGTVVHLVGWCWESDLPGDGEIEGPFAGAFVRAAWSLRPMSELRAAFDVAPRAPLTLPPPPEPEPAQPPVPKAPPGETWLPYKDDDWV